MVSGEDQKETTEDTYKCRPMGTENCSNIKDMFAKCKKYRYFSKQTGLFSAKGQKVWQENYLKTMFL